MDDELLELVPSDDELELLKLLLELELFELELFEELLELFDELEELLDTSSSVRPSA